MRSVLSQLPVTSRLPSGVELTALTLAVWPGDLAAAAPVATSDSEAVLSQLPDASVRPSGDQASDITKPGASTREPGSPVIVRTASPVATFQKRIVRSAPP